MGAYRRVLCALTSVVLVSAPVVQASALETPPPATSPAVSAAQVPAPPITAQAWVVADMDSGAILASRNAELPVRPASTLKLLTAITVVPHLALEQPYRAVAADEVAEGNRVVLYRGLPYTVNDLLHAALLPSANDAAEALARANGGLKVTLEQMNAEAARLGATGTKAMTPSGLDEDGQFTTARDLALIGRAAFANPEILAALQDASYQFPGKMENGKRFIYPLYNHNRTIVNKRFDGYLGGKSGYTSKAGNTLVAGAQRNGRRLVVTMFHISGSTYRSGEALLNWAFANADRLQPVGQLPEPTGPALVFDRRILALPDQGGRPVTRPAVAEIGSDAPTGSGASGWSISAVVLRGLPSPLTLLTFLLGALVILRARVYWVGYRHRTAWKTLEDWSAAQARAERRKSLELTGARH